MPTRVNEEDVDESEGEGSECNACNGQALKAGDPGP